VTEGNSLGARWLTANVLGALASGAVSLAGDGVKLGLLAGINETIRIACMAIVSSVSVAAWSYFVATVLRARLPAMRLRTWIIAHAIAGLLLGGFSEWLGESDAPLAVEDAAEWIVMALMLAAGGAALVAGVGLFHAALLRSVASGLGLWIGCSALAGIGAVLFLPLWAFGPQTGLRHSLTIEAAALAFGILWALVMLPALRRLRPRGP
jgi:hypothetical protein